MDYYNQQYPFPRGYKILEFVLLLREKEKTTIEHIAQFTIQCGEAVSSGF